MTQIERTEKLATKRRKEKTKRNETWNFLSSESIGGNCGGWHQQRTEEEEEL